MSFTDVKNRVWVAYDVFAGWLAHRPMPVRKAGYSIFGGVLWAAYAVPQSGVRATFQALSVVSGRDGPRGLFRGYVRGFLRAMNRIEQVRHGFTDDIDAMFRCPEDARLRSMLDEGGVVMVLPHAHALLAMGRGLSRQYDVLALVRPTTNEKRAASEREIFANLGGEVLDVRKESPATVARTVLKALKGGRLILAAADRLADAPPEETPIDAGRDLVRVEAFGQPVGITGWPARFSAKASAQILPATVVQGDAEISLMLGPVVTPTDDLVETSQAWVHELEGLIRRHPEEWSFALDKHWSRVLKAAASG